MFTREITKSRTVPGTCVGKSISNRVLVRVGGGLVGMGVGGCVGQGLKCMISNDLNFF